jgi:type I restriction enzyme, S subunit
METEVCAIAPSDWEFLSIQDVCSRVTSGGTPTRTRADYYVNGTWPWVKTQELHDTWVDQTEEKITNEAVANSSAKVLPANTILMAMYGATVGQLGITRAPMTCNQACCAMIVDADKADFRYLFYQLRGSKRQLKSLATGAAQQNLSAAIIKTLIVPFPPLPEQRAIASILGAIDDKIELNRRMNATLEAMARALFQSWFVDFDPVRAKLDGRQPAAIDPATAALFSDSFQDSPIGPVPHGWTVGTIEEATSLIIDYRGRTPKKMGSDWSPTGVRAVSAKNVKAGRLVRPDSFNFVSEELYDRWMKDKLALDDILMTSEAPLGELYYLALDARFCLSQRIFAMRANPAVCEPAYLYYWLESPACQADIINRGTGTTVEGIRQSELRKVSVLLPPLTIQKAAAKLLGAWTEQIHRNEEQSRTLAALRDSLLPKLLSGELSVSGIPPSA